MLQHFSELIDKVKAMPRTVVCVANADSETVEAARMALDKGLADVILYGDEAVVRPLVEQAGIEGRAELRHAADPATALREAVRSVRGGESGVLMKGMLNSSDFLRGVLNKEEGLRTGRRLSHIAAVEPLPLVPAMCRERKPLSGFPRAASSARVFSSPFLWPV